ncbi:hypothetical protein [Aquabacterium sp.]|uniref:hypothetical protein n=1 Tax=Aquabacterium sp. TaxID=1872578 RepID=UPI0025C3FAFA|nr:hypothetical protein [Aquabacterium sp.]
MGFLSGITGSLFGGKGSGVGNSTTDQNTATTNTQSNLTGGEGAQNLYASGGGVVNTSDLGAVRAAFDAIQKNDASLGTGFGLLLGATSDIFKTSLKTTQDASASAYTNAAQAYAQAEADKAGGVDQKTMMILAAIGAAVVVMLKRKG